MVDLLMWEHPEQRLGENCIVGPPHIPIGPLRVDLGLPLEFFGDCADDRILAVCVSLHLTGDVNYYLGEVHALDDVAADELGLGVLPGLGLRVAVGFVLPSLHHGLLIIDMFYCDKCNGLASSSVVISSVWRYHRKSQSSFATALMWVPVHTSFGPWKMSQLVKTIFLPAFLMVVSIWISSEGLVAAKNSVESEIEVVLLAITLRILIVVVRSIKAARAPPWVLPWMLMFSWGIRYKYDTLFGFAECRSVKRMCFASCSLKLLLRVGFLMNFSKSCGKFPFMISLL